MLLQLLPDYATQKAFRHLWGGFCRSPDVTSLAEQEPMPPMTPPRDTRRVQALVALLALVMFRLGQWGTQT